MRTWSKRLNPNSSPGSSDNVSRRTALVLPAIALALLHPAGVIANNAPSSAPSQISRDEVSPPNLLTGPDSRRLLEIMHRGIVRCGGPLTAVLRLHVMPDGVIDSFVLQKSSGSACFDQLVMVNAETVAKTRLRVTPAMRNGVAESGWVPIAVAARD